MTHVEADYTSHPLLCTDCCFFVRQEERCNHQEARRVNVVNGAVRLFHASTMRSVGPCGIEGKLWKEKP